MIKLKSEFVFNENFKRALKQVSSCREFSSKDLYNITKLIKVIYTKEVELKKDFDKIVDMYAVKENGQIKLNAQGGFEVDTTKQADWDKAVETFMATDVELDWSKLPMSKLDRAKLNAQDILALEELIEMDIEENQGENNAISITKNKGQENQKSLN